MIQQIETW